MHAYTVHVYNNIVFWRFPANLSFCQKAPGSAGKCREAPGSANMQIAPKKRRELGCVPLFPYHFLKIFLDLQ